MLQTALDVLQDLRDILESEIGTGRTPPIDHQVSDRQRCDDAIIHAAEQLRLT